MSATTSEVKAVGEPKSLGIFDLDDRENEVRSVPDGEVQLIQLWKNPVGSFKIGVRLPLEVKATLIEFLQNNANHMRCLTLILV